MPTRRRSLPPLSKIGDVIRRARQERKWTQTDLADAADTNERVIGGLERGERNPSILNLLYIARALDLRPVDVLGVVTLDDLKQLPRKSARRPGRRRGSRERAL